MGRVLGLQRRPKNQLSFTTSSQEVTEFMTHMWPQNGLQPIGEPHMYRLRHGGATYKLANKLRSLQEVQLRGRWKALKSLKNYEKGGRLAQMFGSLSEATRQRCIEAVQSLDRHLRNLH
jgi:hypothetical protein